MSIKASVNKGLSKELKASFPEVTCVPRPLVEDQKIKDPHWLAGFTAGEGCFLVDVYKAQTNVGLGVTLRFKLSQHSRDAELMKTLVEYLGCGNYYSRQDIGEFIVGRLSDNLDKIIPFFDKYPLQGTKTLDYADFRKVAEIMKTKGHLTQEGLEQIREIKSGMNRGRES